MKHEASYYATAGKTNSCYNGYSYTNSGGSCNANMKSVGSQQIVSNSGLYSINDISRDEAEALCSGQLVKQDGTSISNGHLLPVGLWSKINRDIEQQTINWSGNSVGNGYLSRGFSGPSGTYSGVTINSANDTINNPTTYYSNRAWRLSTGEVIHDLAGNLWEWFYDLHNNSGNTTSTYYSSDNTQRTALGVSVTPAGTYASQVEGDPTGGHGFGYTYNAGVGSGSYAAIFGGYWGDTSTAGVFASGWSTYSSSTHRSISIGFRCVAPAQ